MANRKNTFNKTKIAGIASAMMLASADISALGLGVLDVQSNLDQPLNGVIELRINSGDDVNSVKASIASRSDFANLGIEYPSYLDNINVSVDRSSGVAKLRIDSSNVIIKEPFIHFLMRVDWSGGSFLREYTALIDPPIYAAGTPRSISEPKLVGSDRSNSRPSQVVSSYSSDFNDSRSTYSGQSYSSPTDARYGPVETGETLSSIASQLSNQYPDLSIYQIMKVLFEQNPSAFIDGNINGLVKGAVLNVGDINAIRAVDIQSGKNFFAAQAADWSGRVSTNNIKVSQDQYNDSSDDLIGLSNDIQESFQVGASTDTESLISDSGSDTSNGEAIVLKQQVSELESSLSSSAQENQELKERISILEAQLTDMQNLVSLGVEIDDANLASLENSLSKADEVEVSTDLQAALDNAVDNVDGVIDSSIDTLSGELDGEIGGLNDIGTDLNDIGTDLNDIGTDLNDIGTEVDLGSDSLGVDDDLLLDSASEVIPESSVVESVEASKPKPIIVHKPEPTLFEKIKSAIFDGGIWKLVTGLGVLLFGALAAFFFIRRNRADEEFEISMLSIESNSESINTIDDPSLSRSMSASVTASVMENGEAGDEDGAGQDQETSFLTVYSDSDAVVQADEVDPIAEADVYIAYGRHEQAEEVLLDGVSNYPERIDIKHKLLTVYHKNNNAAGFERIAEELYSQRETLDPQAWQEICTMGKEIDESNPLFELSVDDIAAAGAVAAVSSSVVDGDADDKAPESDELLADIDASPEQPADSDEDIQLINFDEGRSEISELDEVAIDSLELDTPVIDSLELDAPVVDADLSTDDIDVQVDEAGDDVELTVEIDDALDFSTSSLSDEVDSSLVSSDEVADIDFDLADDDDQEFDVGELQEVSDLEVDEDYDELRTQYELAKVFADLGDEDGARKILTDIIADDNAEETLVSDSKKLLATIS